MRVALGLQLLSTVFPEPPWRLRSIVATKEIDYQKTKKRPVGPQRRGLHDRCLLVCVSVPSATAAARCIEIRRDCMNVFTDLRWPNGLFQDHHDRAREA